MEVVDMKMDSMCEWNASMPELGITLDGPPV